MIVMLIILILAAVAVSLVLAGTRWENRRDDRKYPAPGANYTPPLVRVTRAAPHPPAGRRGASPDDEIDAWLAALHHDHGSAWLTAPPPAGVPGRDSPAPSPSAPGERAPAVPAGAAHPAGDPGPPPSHPETWTHWHTALIPAGRHEEAKAAVLDYQPAVPFAFWLDDTFAEQQGGA